MLTFVILYHYLRDCVDTVRGHAHRDRRVQIIMAAKTLLQDYLAWMKDEQKLHETESHEHNYRSLHDAVSEQRKRVKLVRDLVHEIRDASDLQQEEVDSSLLADSYRDLSFLSEKRLECLLDVYKLSTLEDKFNSLSVSADRMSVQLVEDKENKQRTEATSIPDGKASVKAIQECILLVQSNWSWMTQLMSCLNTHMENAAQYHQFFYEVREVDRLMSSQFQELAKLFRTARAADGISDAKRLNNELKELMNTMKYWQERIDDLHKRSSDVVPVHLRTQPNKNGIQVTALCSYQTKEITIKEGDTLKLLDNTLPKAWRVCNARGQEADVPPIICLLPGSNEKAKYSIIRLQLQLLDAYNEVVQLTGKRLILFLSLVFWQYAEDEIHVLDKLEASDKTALLAVFQYLEDTLAQHWSGYSGYTKLCTMLNKLQQSVKATCTDNLTSADKDASAQVLDSTKHVEDMVKSYKEFWESWESYRSQIEGSDDPVCADLLQTWHQQKVIRMPRYSDGELDVEKLILRRSFGVESLSLPNEEIKDNGLSILKSDNSISEATANGSPKFNAMSDDLPGDEIDFEIVPEVANESSKIPSDEFEVLPSDADTRGHHLANDVQVVNAADGVYKISIGGAEKIVKIVTIQDKTGNMLCLTNAVRSGIFNTNDGSYQVDVNSPKMSLIEAIFQNKISVGNLEVEKDDISNDSDTPLYELVQPQIPGLQDGVCRTTVHGKCTDFVIKKFVDNETHKAMDTDAAIRSGVLNIHEGTCKVKTRVGLNKKSLSQAIVDKDVEIDIIGDHNKHPNKWSKFSTVTCDTKTDRIIATSIGGEQSKFTIEYVLDTKNEKWILCSDAKQQHIVDFISFMFIDTKSADCMSLQDAIEQGYIFISLQEQVCDCGFQLVSGKVNDATAIYSANFDDQRKYFRIKRLTNSVTKQQMSSKEVENLIDFNKGVYMKPDSKERMTLTYAIQIGLVIVEYVDIDRINIGIDFRFIAVDPEGPIFSANFSGEQKSFKIREVKCRKTNRLLSLKDGIKSGLFDPFRGHYIDSLNQQKVPLTQSVNDKLLHLEFLENGTIKVATSNDFVELESKECKLFSATIDGAKKPFLIDSVYSANKKEPVSLNQAIVDEIICISMGIYVDRQSGEILSIPQAIAKCRIFVSFVYDSEQSLHANETFEYILPLSTNGVYTGKIKNVQSTFFMSPKNNSQGKIDLTTNSWSLKPHGFISIQTAIDHALIEITETKMGKEHGNVLPVYDLLDSVEDCYVYRTTESDTDTVILTSVIDSVSGEPVPVQQAVQRRLFEPNSGCYILPKSGQTVAFSQAITLKLINIRHISHIPTEVSPLSTSDKSVPKFPFMVNGKVVLYEVDTVFDPHMKDYVKLDDAEQTKLFDITKRTYRNPVTNGTLDFQKAIRTGVVNVKKVKATEDMPTKSGFRMGTSDNLELCTALFHGHLKTFSIDAIVDDSTYIQMTLCDAINNGIFDPLTGNYVKLSTNEILTFSQAVSENFIQLDFRDEKVGPSQDAVLLGTNGDVATEEQIKPREHNVSESVPISPDSVDGTLNRNPIEIIEYMDNNPIIKSYKDANESIFMLHSIKDTQENKILSMADAIAKGIINLDDGTYRDLKSGRKMSLEKAAELNLITIEPVKDKDSSLDENNTKVVRIRGNTDQDNTFTIDAKGKEETVNVTHVVDPITKQHIPINDAIAKGIFEPNTGMYINPKTGRKIRIDIALRLQLISVNYIQSAQGSHQTQENGPAIQFYTAPIDGVKRTFIIKGVRDVKSGTIISMQEAIVQGVVDKSKGQYINNSTQERVSILKAITKGWITVEFIEKDSILGDITKCRRLNIITSSDESILSVTNAEDDEKSYIITGVINPKDKKMISVAEAMRLGIVETKTGRYFDISTGEAVPIVVAVSKGLIIVEEKTDQHKYSEKQVSDLQFSATKETSGVEAEQHVTTVQEEKTTFTITGVINPRTKEEISLYDAINLGIIDNTSGVYANILTGERVPIPVAINNGLIKVEFVKTKKSKEESSSVGVITIETTKEKQSYIVTSVMDADKKTSLTIDEAILKGIFNEETGKYKNTITKQELNLTDAIEQGYVVGEYDTTESSNGTEPEIITQTFSVTGVLDHSQGKTVSFHEAVECGLLDGNTGTYCNNVTGERMFLGDAITEGLIIASLVKDPSSLDVKPENKLVCGRDRIATIRKKLINPLKAINAMKGFTGSKS